jgi:hypothetical protein
MGGDAVEVTERSDEDLIDHRGHGGCVPRARGFSLYALPPRT